MLRAALIGLGGITGSHRRGYANLEEKGIAKLVCACDINPAAIEKKLSINIDNGATPWEEKFNFYTDLEEMLAKEEFDFVLLEFRVVTEMSPAVGIDSVNACFFSALGRLTAGDNCKVAESVLFY